MCVNTRGAEPEWLLAEQSSKWRWRKTQPCFTSQKVHFLAYYFQKHLFKCKATSDLCSRHTGQCWSMRILWQWLYYFVNMLMRCSAVEFVVVGHAVGTSALICVMWQIDKFYEIGCDLLIFELRSGWMTLEGFFRISFWVYERSVVSWNVCCFSYNLSARIYGLYLFKR